MKIKKKIDTIMGIQNSCECHFTHSKCYCLTKNSASLSISISNNSSKVLMSILALALFLPTQNHFPINLILNSHRSICSAWKSFWLFASSRPSTAFNFNMLSRSISLYMRRKWFHSMFVCSPFFSFSSFVGRAFTLLSRYCRTFFCIYNVFTSKRFALASQRNCVRILSSHSHRSMCVLFRSIFMYMKSNSDFILPSIIRKPYVFYPAFLFQYLHKTFDYVLYFS